MSLLGCLAIVVLIVLVAIVYSALVVAGRADDDADEIAQWMKDKRD
jgi:hypothetical protein